MSGGKRVERDGEDGSTEAEEERQDTHISSLLTGAIPGKARTAPLTGDFRPRPVNAPIAARKLSAKRPGRG
jgi:hypothetical protein